MDQWWWSMGYFTPMNPPFISRLLVGEIAHWSEKTIDPSGPLPSIQKGILPSYALKTSFVPLSWDLLRDVGEGGGGSSGSSRKGGKLDEKPKNLRKSRRKGPKVIQGGWWTDDCSEFKNGWFFRWSMFVSWQEAVSWYLTAHKRSRNRGLVCFPFRFPKFRIFICLRCRIFSNLFWDIFYLTMSKNDARCLFWDSDLSFFIPNESRIELFWLGLLVSSRKGGLHTHSPLNCWLEADFPFGMV